MITDNMLAMPFYIGLTFLLVGGVLYFFPPKKINYLYGYRTSKSMKNQETWTFAQKYSSVKMVQGSLFLIAISFLGNFVENLNENNKIIELTTVFLVVIFMFYTTEKALKTKFPIQ